MNEPPELVTTETSEAQKSADNAPGQPVERRRPGRRANVAPSLIPLLRGEDRPSPEDPFSDRDNLDAARGITAAVLLSAAIWAVIGLVWFLLKK
ncbi:MAG: hypothetical protein P4L90_27155 [Rhodopila sp.]|nr:hypothetical protein [Rhodopila sp.]